MRPTFASLDSTDGVISNPVVSGDEALKPAILSDGPYVGFGEFCRSASLSSIGGSVFGPVSLVCRRSIPAQIIKAIIFYVSIVMTPLMLVWGMASKCQKHKAVNLKKPVFIFLPEQQEKTPIFNVLRGLFDVPCFYRSNAPKTRRLVNPLISRYVSPFFHVNYSIVGYGDIVT